MSWNLVQSADDPGEIKSQLRLTPDGTTRDRLTRES